MGGDPLRGVRWAGDRPTAGQGTDPQPGRGQTRSRAEEGAPASVTDLLGFLGGSIRNHCLPASVPLLFSKTLLIQLGDTHV